MDLLQRATPEEQLVEVTRDKRLVWTFKNFRTFGNGLAATRVLDERGDVTRPRMADAQRGSGR